MRKTIIAKTSIEKIKKGYNEIKKSILRRKQKGDIIVELFGQTIEMKINFTTESGSLYIIIRISQDIIESTQNYITSIFQDLNAPRIDLREPRYTELESNRQEILKFIWDIENY